MIQWKIVGSFLLGIVVGAGIIYVYSRYTYTYQYTCVCTTIQGGAPQWHSDPAGHTCPPPGVDPGVCP